MLIIESGSTTTDQVESSSPSSSSIAAASLYSTTSTPKRRSERRVGAKIGSGALVGLEGAGLSILFYLMLAFVQYQELESILHTNNFAN